MTPLMNFEVPKINGEYAGRLLNSKASPIFTLNKDYFYSRFLPHPTVFQQTLHFASVLPKIERTKILPVKIITWLHRTVH